jgi:hypothetical protein
MPLRNNYLYPFALANLIDISQGEIWQLARELHKFVFEITSVEPFVNDFRFRDQIRASSGSVSDNIACPVK